MNVSTTMSLNRPTSSSFSKALIHDSKHHDFNISEPPKQAKWVHNVLSWQPLPDHNFNVSFPVFVASLPKSGTTSIYAYFLCGGVRSVHTYCPLKNPDDGSQVRIGAVMEANVKNGNPPFQGCGDDRTAKHGAVKVFSDTGYVRQFQSCYYPSISALEAMYASYPNMTILLGVRNSTKWYDSFKKWNQGGLQYLWATECTLMPNRTKRPDEFIQFYEWHNSNVREFANRHPSVTFIEFDIESPSAGIDLEQATNISSKCWGRYQPKNEVGKG